MAVSRCQYRLSAVLAFLRRRRLVCCAAGSGLVGGWKCPVIDIVRGRRVEAAVGLVES
jgi:hypothetical protein